MKDNKGEFIFGENPLVSSFERRKDDLSDEDLLKIAQELPEIKELAEIELSERQLKKGGKK